MDTKETPVNNETENPVPVRERGTVRWFSQDRGYGFISRANGGDVFVHYSALEDEDRHELIDGVSVEFEVGQTPKGSKAQNVVILQSDQEQRESDA